MRGLYVRSPLRAQHLSDLVRRGRRWRPADRVGALDELGERKDENVGAVGASYEYRFNKLFGLGGFVEYSGGSVDAWSFGVPLYIRPIEEVRLEVAPGFEREEGKTDFLFRVGGAYEFEIAENMALGPELFLDFVDRHVNGIYGLGFGVHF